MFKFSLFDLTTKASIAYIDRVFFSLTKAEIKLGLGEPHQLNIAISPTYPHYDKFFDSSIGILYETSTLRILFVVADTSVDSQGVVEILAYSSISQLAYSMFRLKDIAYSGNLSNFLSLISGDFIFRSISGEKNIELQTGVKNNLVLLDEAIRKPVNFTWRENGLNSSNQTVILYGDFGADINSYYEETNDLTAQPIKPIAIKNVGVVNNGQTFSHLLAVGDTGAGTETSTSVRLTNPQADYIDIRFPLVPVYNTYTNNYDYYIFNSNYNTQIRPERYREYVLTYSGTEGDKEKILYKEAVSYLQSFSFSSYNSVDLDIDKAYLPGNQIKIKFIKKVNGKTVVNIDENQTLKGYSYNLNTLQQ